jgi:uncharacterized protein YbjT (DUF2867 family)
MSKRDGTLVVGGTGKTGRRVVERQQHRGLPFRVASRSGNPAFDWEDRETWSPCLDGMTQAYVTYYPDVCVPGALDTLQSFFARAVEAGVRKIVFLSGRGEVEALQAEDALKASGAEWTILRCSFFCQNFSESFFLDPILAGELALPVGPVAEPFVDADDIADVASRHSPMIDTRGNSTNSPVREHSLLLPRSKKSVAQPDARFDTGRSRPRRIVPRWLRRR